MSRKEAPRWASKLDKMLEKIIAIVGNTNVITDKKDLLTYKYAATASGMPPAAVILPESTEDISRILQLLYRYEVPVIARGAGTNLNGGTILAGDNGETVVLELAKLNKILEIDPDNRYMLVEPGVTNLEVQLAAKPYGFYYAPDPASQQVSTIGGNIAENAGGPRCVKYGVTANHVQGLELVLSDGRVIVSNGPLEGLPGYDLTGIMHATEGTFAVITKAWLKLMKLPEATKTLMVIFDSLDDAANSVSQIIAQGIIPTTLELIDKPVLQAVEETVKIGYPLDAEAVLLIEVDGFSVALDSQAQQIISICQKNNVRETRVAKNEKERDIMWEGRRGAVGSIARLKPSYAEEDITIPRTKLPEMLRTIARLAKEYSLIIGNVFHAGDGNFHPVVLYDERNAEETQRVTDVNYEIMKEAAKLGGTITGEHGIGIEKLKGMPLTFTEDTMVFMRKLKLAFDEKDILNPGKVIPANICDLVSRSNQCQISAERKPKIKDFMEAIEHVGIIIGEAFLDKYACHGQKPCCAVKANSTEDVINIVQLANKHQASLIPWGQGSKSDVGCRTVPAETVLDLSNLNRIIDIDFGNLTATVEAGVKLKDLQRLLLEKNLFLPVDPIQKAEPTIGGLTAANSTGSLRLQYKTIKDMLLGVEVVTPEGKQIKYGGKNIKNVAGYDLCKLFVGSWGTLGIITKITLKLFPLPQQAIYKTFSMEDRGLFQSFLNEIYTGLETSSLDFVISDRIYYVNIGLSGPAEAVDMQAKILNGLFKPGIKQTAHVEDRALQYGKSFIIDKLPTGYFQHSGLILKSSLLYTDITRWIDTILKAAGDTKVIIYGHAANGIVISYFPEVIDNSTIRKAVSKFEQETSWGVHIIEICSNQFESGHTDARKQMEFNSSHLKAALDPSNILNPGRSVGGRYYE